MRSAGAAERDRNASLQNSAALERVGGGGGIARFQVDSGRGRCDLFIQNLLQLKKRLDEGVRNAARRKGPTQQGRQLIGTHRLVKRIRTAPLALRLLDPSGGARH